MGLFYREWGPRNKMPMPDRITVGEPIYRRCLACDNWVRISDGKHINLQEISLAEFLKLYKEECPNEPRK